MFGVVFLIRFSFENVPPGTIWDLHGVTHTAGKKLKNVWCRVSHSFLIRKRASWDDLGPPWGDPRGGGKIEGMLSRFYFVGAHSEGF